MRKRKMEQDHSEGLAKKAKGSFDSRNPAFTEFRDEKSSDEYSRREEETYIPEYLLLSEEEYSIDLPVSGSPPKKIPDRLTLKHLMLQMDALELSSEEKNSQARNELNSAAALSLGRGIFRPVNNRSLQNQNPDHGIASTAEDMYKTPPRRPHPPRNPST